MITEPTNGWAKNALQEYQTLYIGGAEPAAVRRALWGEIKTMRDCEGKFNDQDGSYRLGDGSFGDGSNGNKHEVER